MAATPADALFHGPVAMADLPGWADDEQHLAVEAARQSALMPMRPIEERRYDPTEQALSLALGETLCHAADTASAARAFFATHFDAWLVQRRDGAKGLVTAYYEPEVDSSRQRTPVYNTPLHKRPADLVDLDDANRPKGMDPYFRFGRQTPDGIVEFFDRGAIMDGALDGRGLELVWLKAVDAFYIHIQGSARLRFADGTTTRVGYAGKSGHRFSGISMGLLKEGAIDRSGLSMQGTRAWLDANPHRHRDVLARNRSYIFFQEVTESDPKRGPFGAEGCQLTEGRSIAVDKALWRYGTPFFIDAPGVRGFGKPFRRLMIAQDTGSAITGAARADLFLGSGEEAGELAGGLKEEARFWVFWPKGAVPPGRVG
ncbi:murein transglycosylase A [Notoacmeibacter sp. MSK16QG-6]|uniref:murein transglycosylase A n=1 Tax=Notoacmeibacter sp. MSK16QG-6 TaxID=2957982 RepID=UPI00209E557B|nr:MltA domain-containing protein [Notoacmeibacter sp. MSK16QG-6]MCP1199098.1 MltA domain-containing protein [Notoacmeibacter sp. MSK16QG-6]